MITTIAEIGQAHDGSLGAVHAYIDALATTGVTAVKFQTHIAHAESSIYEPFRVKFSKQDARRYDYWKRMEFTAQQWMEIGAHCKEVGLQFISSPFSNAAVDVLEQAGVEVYKIGSGEVNNFLLLEKVAKTGKPVIISSGMSNFTELDATVEFLKARKVAFSILQCTTSYPTRAEQYGLNVIGELKERYGVPVGFSDHSAKTATGIAAVALGASILEFHVVFDRAQFGPDSSSSLTISEVADLVKAVSEIETAMENPIDKSDNSAFSDLKDIFEKSLAVNKDLPAGHILSFDDLEAKKPKNKGLDAAKFESVLGKALKSPIEAWDFLTENHLDL